MELSSAGITEKAKNVHRELKEKEAHEKFINKRDGTDIGTFLFIVIANVFLFSAFALIGYLDNIGYLF